MTNIPDASRRQPLTYRERTLWLLLTTTSGIYAWYFTRAISAGAGRPWHAVGLFIEALILLIVLQIIGSIVLLAGSRREGKDERDHRIHGLSVRNSYVVLVLGVWLSLGVALLSLGAFWDVHALLLVLVIAQLVLWASQLYYYRFGV